MRKVPLFNLYLISGKELQKQQKQQKEQQDRDIIASKVLKNLLHENSKMRKICERYGQL